MNNAVIYARYSAGPRQTDQSIEGQIADCNKYAEANGLIVTAIYADRHVSGKSTEGRDEFLRMIADAKCKKFTDVIVWKVDRFGRDKADIAIFKRELKKCGVKLHYAAESVPDGPEGIILEALLEGLAEYYSADLRQKVSRGMKESLKKGQYPSKLPYGYTKAKDKTVIVDEEAAPIVREIFRLYNQGHTIAEIERNLAHKGIEMKNGSIYRILHNKHYLGKFEMMGIEITVPPIITEEEWNKALEMSERPSKGNAKMDYLFSGKCQCGICKSYLTGTHGTSKTGKKFAYYQCKNKCIKPIPKDRYEMVVLEEVRSTILTDELITQIVDRIMEIQSADLPNAEIKRLEAQIRDFKKRMENLTNSIESGVPASVVAPRIAEYNSHIEELTIELERLKIKKPLIPREYLVKWLESFRDGDISDDNFCHRFIQTFIERIVVQKDHSVVVLNITGDASSESSNLMRIVNQNEIHSNSGISICLPYALLKVVLETTI